MKTNVVIKSQDRNLFGVVIRQESKTGFLNVSDLSKAYEIERAKKDWSYRRVNEVFDSALNAERIYYILKKRGYLKGTDFESEYTDGQSISIKGGIHAFMEHVNYNGLTKTLKSLRAYKTTGRGDNKSMWCDPYIWMLIAMELHPVIYAETACWMTDNLLLNRIEAGSSYPNLCKAISKFPDTDYVRIGKALNCIVFGKHEEGMRNYATSEQLKELDELEKNLTFLVTIGSVKSFDKLIEVMIHLYNEKWNPIKTKALAS